MDYIDLNFLNENLNYALLTQGKHLSYLSNASFLLRNSSKLTALSAKPQLTIEEIKLLKLICQDLVLVQYGEQVEARNFDKKVEAFVILNSCHRSGKYIIFLYCPPK